VGTECGAVTPCGFALVGFVFFVPGELFAAGPGTGTVVARPGDVPVVWDVAPASAMADVDVAATRTAATTATVAQRRADAGPRRPRGLCLPQSARNREFILFPPRMATHFAKSGAGRLGRSDH
jgi:hypothetical protein